MGIVITLFSHVIADTQKRSQLTALSVNNRRQVNNKSKS